MTKITISDSSSPKKSGKGHSSATKNSSTKSKKPRKISINSAETKKSPAKSSTNKKAASAKSTPRKINVSTKSTAKKEQPKASSKPAKKISVGAVSSTSTHSTVQKSTTLSRRYVKPPKAAKAEVAAPAPTPAPAPAPTPTPTPAPKVSKKAAKKDAKKDAKKARLAEKRLRAEREQALKKARVAKAEAEKRALKSAGRAANKVTEPLQMDHAFRKKRRGRRIALALVCSAATVGALVAFVHLNMPDISVRVAAMQTGIEATYPTFVPRNYSLSNVTSDKDGIVTMYFNGPDGASFSLSEERSTWDSNALLNNYVKKSYPSDYITLREQGITIYARGEYASWVNGGILYKIEASGKNLTKEQIRNIATSL